MLYIHLFGEFHLQSDGAALKWSALPKTLPLLAYLLINRDTAVARDTLAFTLWPDVNEAEARANLRRHLYELRRMLPAEQPDAPWLLTTAKSVQWNVTAPYWLDVALFEQWSRQPKRRGEAVELYTGALLPSVDEEWLWFERERLRNLQINALQALTAEHRRYGAYELALRYAQRALREDPLREDMLRETVALFYLLGDRAGALRAYQQFTKLIAEEVAAPPMQETMELARLIEQQAAMATVLKHLDGEEVVEPAPIPADRQSTLAAPPLPTPMRRLLGRESELAALVALLTQADPPVRLLTLTGAGGIGKTRLALEAAHRLCDQQPPSFPDGIFLASLAALSAPNLLLPAIADTLSLSLTSSHSVQSQLIEHLRYKQVLLLLDNFEHLLPAAIELMPLLAAAPGLSLLVTSQAVLNLYGEQEFPLAPFPLPKPIGETGLSELQQNPGVALFCEAGRAANANFLLTGENAQTVAEICTRLDGLPLAIELAAARSKLFPPAELLGQLADALNFLRIKAQDLPPRHRTLRAAIQWSYDLFDQVEQQHFRQLALFADSFTLTAVAAVFFERPTSRIDELEHGALDAVTSLVEKSMVRAVGEPAGEEPRFALLGVVRAFAQEKLAADPQQPLLRMRYVRYYAQFARQAQVAWDSAEQPTWIGRVRREADNLRLALAWSLDVDAEQLVEMGAQLLLDLEPYWSQALLHMDESRHWLELLLKQRQLLPAREQARLLNLSATCFAQIGIEWATIAAYHEESLGLASKLNDPSLLADAVLNFAKDATEQQEFGRATELLVGLIAGLDAANPENKLRLASARNNLAIIHYRQGRHEEALTILEGVADTLRTQGTHARLIAALNNLGNIARATQNFVRDAHYLREGLRLVKEVDHQLMAITLLSSLAERAFLLQDDSLSTRLHSALQAICQRSNMVWPAYYRREFGEYVTTLRRRLPADLFAQAWNQGANLTLAQAIQDAEGWLDRH